MVFPFNLFGSQPVAPERVSTDTVIPLSDRDDNRTNRSISLEFTMVFDEVLDAEKLSGALWRLFERPGWRKLGARLRLNVRCASSTNLRRTLLTRWKGCRKARVPRPRAIHPRATAHQLHARHRSPTDFRTPHRPAHSPRKRKATSLCLHRSLPGSYRCQKHHNSPRGLDQYRQSTTQSPHCQLLRRNNRDHHSMQWAAPRSCKHGKPF
jgi:hypothetical protein